MVPYVGGGNHEGYYGDYIIGMNYMVAKGEHDAGYDLGAYKKYKKMRLFHRAS